MFLQYIQESMTCEIAHVFCCDFTRSSHSSLKLSLVRVRHTWWGVQNRLSVMSTSVTFLHSNLLKGNREPGFGQMQDCESLASRVTVYHSQLLYIDMCCLYVANLLCFSTGCNKLYIYREHVWWCWQHGHLFTINTNGKPYSIPFVSLDSSVNPLPPFLPHPTWRTAHCLYDVLYLSSFFTIYTTITGIIYF
jgi:hypothetical protein